MTTYFVTFVAAATMTLPGQAPAPATTPQPMTISGCLQQREIARDIAPRDRGLPQDYILTNVKMSPSSTVSGIGVSTKYQVLGVAEVELKKHLNHHVELIGQIVPPGSTGQPSDDTPDFQATTMKMVSLACNAAQ